MSHPSEKQGPGKRPADPSVDPYEGPPLTADDREINRQHYDEMPEADRKAADEARKRAGDKARPRP